MTSTHDTRRRPVVGQVPFGTFDTVRYTSPSRGHVLDLTATSVSIYVAGSTGAALRCAVWFEDVEDPSGGLTVVGQLTAGGLILDAPQEHPHADVLATLVRDTLADPTFPAAMLSATVTALPEPVATGHSAQEATLAAKKADLLRVHAAVTASTFDQRAAALTLLAAGYDGTPEALVAAVTGTDPVSAP